MSSQQSRGVAPPSTIRRRLKTLSGRLARLAEKETLDPQELTKVRAELVGVERVARGRKRQARGEGARTQILQYLKEHVGQPVFGEELREVSGIQEWARRVRELRVESGYTIIEDGGRYTLVSPDPDPEVATRWARANEIRRQPGDARSRIAAILRENVGRVVSLDELLYVGKISEVARRVRELREEGYQISSHNDRPDLRPGQYVLETLP
jgi:biotin operon repressor